MPFYNTYPGFLYCHTSLRDKAGLVAGSNTGLGYQACAHLLRLGLSHLILAVRKASKGEAARRSLLASLPASAKILMVEVWELDLNNYARSNIQIDFALLNTGVANFNFIVNRSTSHETTVQINWLSTALLSCPCSISRLPTTPTTDVR
ncbi:hypothetical protein N7467_009179 [Penicillium canescens]|nr:hypothetical protein N7467_009179 [Penicillium canescens]